MTNLGELLRLYRAVHGLSTRDLADRVGVTVSSLSRFERTDVGMSADHFMRIAQWLLTRIDNDS